MVQSTMDSKTTERGHGNSEPDFPSVDKQPPIAAKKTALRELHNENIIKQPSTTKTVSSLKDKDSTGDPIKVAGTKRPPPPPPSDFSVSPPRNFSPGNSPANGQLVYVRRKSETEIAKSPNHLQSAPVSVQQQSLSQIKEPRLASYPAFASIPFISPTGSSAKPLMPFSVGMTGAKMGPLADSKYGSVASGSSPMENSNTMKNLHWEERYKQLQKLLKDLEQADHKDYLQTDLSSHAVELEKRSIQLSLEEAKEMQRVAMLNMLGKPMKNT